MYAKQINLGMPVLDVPLGVDLAVGEWTAPYGKGSITMLRIYFLQQWYALADEALEDALYDMPSPRLFAGIDLSSAAAPEATTLLELRHLLERHELTVSTHSSVSRTSTQAKVYPP